MMPPELLHSSGSVFIMYMCVCVCACPPVMRGDTANHALTSTSSPPPNDVPSIPWSPVVLPLWTPWGACQCGFQRTRVSWMQDSMAVAVGQLHNLETCPFKSSPLEPVCTGTAQTRRAELKLGNWGNCSDSPYSAHGQGAVRSGNQVPISYRITRRPHSSCTKVRTQISYKLAQQSEKTQRHQASVGTTKSATSIGFNDQRLLQPWCFAGV